MASIPRATLDHYREIQKLQLVAIKAGRIAWEQIDPNLIVDSWARATSSLQPLVEAAQVRAATAGASYGAATLAEQGAWVAPEAFVNPQAFAGVASDGRGLAGLLQSPAFRTLDAIDTGMDVVNALKVGRSNMDALMSTVVADAGRQAAGVDTAARKGVSYVRMLNPPSCSRCTILAGRRFRWNDGFLRHPRCDCVHVQTTLSLEAARAEGLIDDPYEYFKSLSESEQDRIFTKGGAQAIRDGGDIYRVENARRGKAGMLTTEGTGKRGYARDLKGRRLTPEGIYRQAGSREEALELLERHGYILPGGQVPGGSIRGWDYEGYGALGRGGTRVGARTQIDIDRATGTQSRYSMTEAQRRLYDSELNYREVLAGRNPYGKGPLTPDIAAMAEKDYRRWLASDGQIFGKTPALRLVDTPTQDQFARVAGVPDDIAAKFKVGTSVDALGGANPNYSMGANYAYNCGNSVTAYELRSRGLLVSALPVDEAAIRRGGIQVTDFLNSWRTPTGAVPELAKVGGVNGVRSALKSWPDDARGFLVVGFKGGAGHVLMVEKAGGITRYIDAQSGQVWQPDFFRRVRPKAAWMVRSDNLTATGTVADMVEAAT